MRVTRASPACALPRKRCGPISARSRSWCRCRPTVHRPGSILLAARAEAHEAHTQAQAALLHRLRRAPQPLGDFLVGLPAQQIVFFVGPGFGSWRGRGHSLDPPPHAHGGQ